MTITIKIQKVTVPALENLTLEGVELQVENPLAALTNGGIFGDIESLVEAIIEDGEKEAGNEPEIDSDFHADMPEGLRAFLEAQKAAQEEVKAQTGKSAFSSPFPFAGNIDPEFNPLKNLHIPTKLDIAKELGKLHVPTQEEIAEQLQQMGGFPFGKLVKVGVPTKGNEEGASDFLTALKEATEQAEKGGGVGFPGLPTCIVAGPGMNPQEIDPEKAIKMITELGALGNIANITAFKKGNK